MVLVLNKILITISIRYPYYHELQLPTINDYYFSKSKLNVSNNDSIQMSELNFNHPSQTLITTEQNDLNAIYKSGRRYKRTSYNTNFQNVDEILASFANKNENVTIQKLDASLDEKALASQNNTAIKKTSWFTQKQGNNAQNFITDRKSFYRPKTPILSLDARRKNLPEAFARDQKYNTATNFENISRRTDNLIDRFRKNYDS